MRTRPSERHDGGAKAHARADEMHDIHRPNGGEARASEHASQAEKAKGGKDKDDSKGFAA